MDTHTTETNATAGAARHASRIATPAALLWASAFLLAAHLQGRAWAPALALANRFSAAMCGQAGASASDPASFYPPWRAALAALPKELG